MKKTEQPAPKVNPNEWLAQQLGKNFISSTPQNTQPTAQQQVPVKQVVPPAATAQNTVNSAMANNARALQEGLNSIAMIGTGLKPKSTGEKFLEEIKEPEPARPQAADKVTSLEDRVNKMASQLNHLEVEFRDFKQEIRKETYHSEIPASASIGAYEGYTQGKEAAKLSGVKGKAKAAMVIQYTLNGALKGLKEGVIYDAVEKTPELLDKTPGSPRPN